MSSGSESDEDYVPGEPEQLSEEGSADEETDLQYEKEFEHKTKKRKATQANEGIKKQRKNAIIEKNVEPEEEKLDAPKNTEEEKKREEDLWAKFLEGTDTKPKAALKETTPSTAVSSQGAQPAVCKNKNKIETTNVKAKDDAKDRERRIFEFAGETIVVENNVIKEKIKSADTTATGSNGLPSRSRGSGLSGVLNHLNKKNSLSTLEKSKLDWTTYKKQEGIEEEIDSHNKGKAGYLDRQDFLERADVRQYEIERDLRMSRRSNR